MKAVVYISGQMEPGFVLDHPRPAAAAGEALIRVTVAGICSTDLEILKGYMGFSGVLGHEFVGVVVEGPTELRNRRVVGEINCVAAGRPRAGEAAGWVNGPDADGHRYRKHAPDRTVLGIAGRDGAFAEYVALPAVNCHVVPDSVGDRAAVFTEPLAAAVQVIEDHSVSAETRVAVIGSGRLGILCAQVLALQSRAVIVLGRNARTLGVCEAMGLRTGRLDAASELFDLVVECTGAAAGLRAALKLVRPRGTIVLKSTYSTVPQPPAIDLSPAVINEITIAGNRCGPFADALELLAKGAIEVERLIEAEFPLEQAAQAFEQARQPGALKVLLRP